MQIQINAKDYASGIQIEAAFCDQGWNVPAWEEWGFASFCGDVPDYAEHNGERFVIGYHWSSVEAAQAALAAEGYGVRHVQVIR